MCSYCFQAVCQSETFWFLILILLNLSEGSNYIGGGVSIMHYLLTLLVFSITHVVGTHRKCLAEMLLMSIAIHLPYST